MNHTYFFRIPLAMLLGVTALFCSLTGMSQYEDNPNLDQVPLYLRNQPRPPATDVPLSSVITLNNWDNFNLGVNFAESNMAANPQMPAWYFTAYNINDAHHTEDGINWSSLTPSFGATMQGDPVVAYDSLGNLFYENMYGPSSIQGCKVMKSTNNGATWGASVTAISGVDKNWMACDQTAGPYANYVYTCMTGGPGGNFARSTDHGVTFQTTFSPTTQSLPGMMVCVGPNGNTQGGSVYVVTNSGTTFASTYTFYRSTDGGANFTLQSSQNFAGYVGTNVGGRHSVENMRTRPYPMIAADNSYGAQRGRLYCVYATNDPPGNGNKADIWCKYSDNAGATWSSAVRINDDANPTTHHQWHPAIWCDKETGRLYAMWMDTRDCPTSDSAMIYASYSDNGGATWATNQALSNAKMKINCPSCGGGGTPRYQGDYNGIVSNKKVSMAGWTDFRAGSYMSVTSYFPDFAMALTPLTGTLTAPSDSVTFTVSVPAVKLYTDTVVLTGQINPAPATGSITFIYPQGNKITTFPGSKTVRVKLTGNVPAGSYQATFYAKGPNGTPAHLRTATLTVQVPQYLAVSVTATPSVVCTGNSTQLQASASGGTAPYTYTWTSNPPGFTSSLPNPSATPTANTWYKCVVHDNAAAMVQDSVFVTLSSLPSTPGAITGNVTPCQGATIDYSIAAVTGATSYAWTVPPGSSILSGQGTTAISVLMGAGSGNVSVTAGNTCGNSAASVLAITPSPLPASPGPITGPTDLCSNTSGSYSIAPVTGVTITWTVPMGATITSGQGTATISVLWGVTSGYVSVTTENTCGPGTPSNLMVTVETVPAAAQAITGTDTVCLGESGYQYSIPAIANATSYVWTIPAGASISQGQGTHMIQVDFSESAISGNITAAGANECGTGDASSMPVEVVVCTGIQTIPLQSQIIVYPNPARSTLTVAINGTEKHLRLRIMDMSGRCLYDELLENLPAAFTRQIDVSGFAKGLYLIRLTNDSRAFIGRFEVE